MKKLDNITDKRMIHLIEAVRISYLIAESNYNILTDLLQKIDNTDVDPIILIYSSAWTLIDVLHRYGDCIQKIRGLPHKDVRYSDFLNHHHKEINPFRNYMQHLTGHKTLKTLSQKDIYPVMGALAWTFDGLKSKTITYATLPSGTCFNTLPYSIENKRYQIDVKIGCLDKELSLMRSIEKLKKCHSYFKEFLLSNKYISTEELRLSHIDCGPIYKKCISNEGTDVSNFHQNILKEDSKNEVLRCKVTVS